MNIMLLGAPGSGKGTLAKQLADHFNIPHISTGDLLRNSSNVKFKEYMDKGLLVPDDMIAQALKQRIKGIKGFILDGFPRTLNQAKSLDSICIDKVINLDVSKDVILDRLTGRLVHTASGRVYHETKNPPKVAGIDDITGEALTKRTDDKEEVILDRLSIYHKNASAILSHYKAEQLITIEGDDMTAEEVFKASLRAFSGHS